MSSASAPNPYKNDNDYIDMSWLFLRMHWSDETPDYEEYFATPTEPVTLSPSARETLNKLKTRDAWHLQSLRDEWPFDLQILKHETKWPDNDKNGIVREAGLLIAMSEKWARHLQDIISNTDTKQVERQLKQISNLP